MTKPSAALRDLCSELELSEYMLRKFMKVFQKERKTALDDTAESHTFLPSFVFEVPSGEEKGRFLTLDIEGIPVRVVLINLKRKSFDLRAKQFMLPQDIMRGSGEQFFDFLAQRVNQFACENKVDEQGLPLGITISFPIKSTSIKSGSLIRWTKGFSCDGVINENFCEKLQEAIWKLEDLRLDVCALVTDSTATLLAAAWKADKCKIGLNIGTGTNISYVESMKKIAALSEYTLKFHNIIINTEYGNMGLGGSIDFIRTGWDRDLDNATVQPGLNMLEKMISSIYLGEFVRRVLVTATQRGVVFRGAISERLLTVGSFEPNFLIDLGEDWTSQRSARNILNKLGYPMPWSQDCVDLQYVCQVVWTRSAHLVAASVAALLCSLRYANVTIGVDGTFYRAHPGYPEALNKKLRELTDPQITFQFVVADDGGGLGGALAANMSNKDNYLSRGTSEQRRDSFFAKFDIENISGVSSSHSTKLHSTVSTSDTDVRQRKQSRKGRSSSPTSSGERLLQGEKKKKGSSPSKTSLHKSSRDDLSKDGSVASESSTNIQKSKRVSPDKPKKSVDHKQDSREGIKSPERSSKKPDHHETKDEQKTHDESGAKRKVNTRKNEGSKSSDEGSRKGGSSDHKGADSKKDSHEEKSRDNADAKRENKPRPEIAPRGRRGTTRGSVRGAPNQSEDPTSSRTGGGGSAANNRNRRGRPPPSNSHHTPGNPGTEDEGSGSVDDSCSSSAEQLQELMQNKIGINLHKRSSGNTPASSPIVARKSITQNQSGNKNFETIPTTWERTKRNNNEILDFNSTDVATKNHEGDKISSKEQMKRKESNPEMNKKLSDLVIKSPIFLSRTSKIELDKGEVSDGDKKQSRESKLRIESPKGSEKSSKSSSNGMKRGKSSIVLTNLHNLTDEDREDLPVKKSLSVGKGPEEKHIPSRITNGKLNGETRHERNQVNEQSITKAERKSQVVKNLTDFSTSDKSGEKAPKRGSSSNTSKQETKSSSTQEDDRAYSKARQSCAARSSRDSQSLLLEVGEVGRRNSKKRSEKLDEESEVKGDGGKSQTVFPSEATGIQQRSASISKTEIKNPKISAEENSHLKKTQGNTIENSRQKDKKVHAEESSPKKMQRSESLFVKSEKQAKNSDSSQNSRKSLKQTNDEISSHQKPQGSIVRLDKKESPGEFSNASIEGAHKEKRTPDDESSTSKRNQGKKAPLHKREGLAKPSDTSGGTRRSLKQPNDENPPSEKGETSNGCMEKREQPNTTRQESFKSPGVENSSSKNVPDTNKTEQNRKGKTEKVDSKSAMNDEKLPLKSNKMLGQFFFSDKQDDQRVNEVIDNIQHSRQKIIINTRHSEEYKDLSEMHESNDSPLENVSADNRRSFVSQTCVEEYATNVVRKPSEEGKKQVDDSLTIQPDGLHYAGSFSSNATTRNTSNSSQDNNLPVMERQPSFVHLNPVSKTFPAKESDTGNIRNEVRKSSKIKEKVRFKSDEGFSRIKKPEIHTSGIPASKFSTINSTSNRRLAEMTQLSRISVENAIQSTAHQ